MKKKLIYSYCRQRGEKPISALIDFNKSALSFADVQQLIKAKFWCCVVVGVPHEAQ